MVPWKLKEATNAPETSALQPRQLQVRHSPDSHHEQHGAGEVTFPLN